MTKIQGCVLVSLVAILGPLMLAGQVHAEMVDRIVAEVNNEIITMSELQNLAKSVEAQSGVKPGGMPDKKMQREMLEALIDRKLAKAEAKRRGITVSPKELDEALNRFKERNHVPDDEILVKGLANQGLTLKEFKQQISDQIMQDRLLSMAVGSKVTIDDAEVRRIYDQQFKQGGAQVHLVTLRLPFPQNATEAQKEETKKKAETILLDIKRGDSFTAAAQKLGLKPSDVGFVTQSDLDPRLGEYLSKLKTQEVAPIATPAGFQLIQIVDRRSGEARPFNEVAPEIRRMLTQREMEKQFGEWVKNLREKAHIKIML
jgi:peptidyl-prolyl cis-trans isomerase SurA